MTVRNPGWGLVKRLVVMFRNLKGMRRQVYMYNIFKFQALCISTRCACQKLDQ